MDWALPAGVKAVCTTRVGGVSQAPFDGFNLGDHVQDDVHAVAHNRALLQAQLGGARPLFLSQVHGVDVVQLNAATLDGTKADACITSESRVACTIMVADCLPILFYSSAKKVVAAAHAGWRGLAGASGQGGVLEATRRALRSCADLEDVKVWLGPCIGPQAFEVGEEVRQAFMTQDHLSALAFEPLAASGQYLCDLAQLARLELAKWPVASVEGNDSTPSWCTFSNPSVFFSYRRDGVTGRFAAGIGLVD